MPNLPTSKKPQTLSRSLWTLVDAGEQSDVTVPIHLAYYGIAAALRRHATIRSSNLAILEVPTPDAIDTFLHAGRLFLKQVLNRNGYDEPFVRAIKRTKSDKLTEHEIFRRAAEDGKGILFCTNLDHVDEELRLFADVVGAISRPTSHQIAAAFRCYGHVLTNADEEMVASESWTRLVYAFQPNRPVRVALRRLRETANRAVDSKTSIGAGGPSLVDLSGFGHAKNWGLELARDLADFKHGLVSWDDVDTGALISGPPGTGKTLFAEALARTCGLPIVATSAAQWQARGSLNDLLKAMRESFREAACNGPGLLLIDEIDAIGSRAINDSQHADYKRQVINGLLELLDGFERRNGLVVIGATNHPENVDPAVVRPGRLDRQFYIPLPDAIARQQIFQLHAGFAIPPDYEERFARSTAGMSGAGLKQLVRDGRRTARRQGMTFELQHVVQVSMPLIDLPTEHMRVAALHEAGHAIVGVELGLELQEITINDKVLAEGLDTLGGARFATPTFPMKTRSYFLNHTCMYLAGLAAETLVFGEFTESGGDPRSDLSVATALATKIEGCLGMGATLAVDIVEDHDLARLRSSDFRLRKAVNDLLDDEFKRAKTILERRYDALHAVAEALRGARAMTASEVQEVLKRHPARECASGDDADSSAYDDRIGQQAPHGLHRDDGRRDVDAVLQRSGMI